MEDPVLCLTSPANPSAQIILSPNGVREPPAELRRRSRRPPAAVDAAHAEAVRRGLRIVYPLTEEPLGVHRFFVEDPGGTIINVLADVA